MLELVVVTSGHWRFGSGITVESWPYRVSDPVPEVNRE